MGKSKWTEEEINDLKYMVENGFLNIEIAEVLGKSQTNIGYKIKELDLKSPRKFREKNGLVYCISCKEYKPKELFTIIKNKHNNSVSFSSSCKPCKRNYDNERYRNKWLKEIQKKESAEIRTKEDINGSTFKLCPKCGELKTVEEFNWNIKYKQLYNMCKTCSREKNRINTLER